MASSRIAGITIEIGGDTTKLVKALSSVDKAVKQTQTNLRDINKALKFDPGNTALLKDKQVELGNAINETKQKLEAEKQALEQMQNSPGFDKNSESARNLKTQIDLDTAALKELEAQARQASSVLGTQMQLAGQKMQEVGQKIKAVGQNMTSLGRDMTTKVTVPIAAAFGAAIKTTMDFDTQMSKVQAISGATGQEFSALEAKAREMGESTKFSATEAGEAFEYMGMAGWKADEMIQGIPGVLNLAAASGEELGTTSDIVTDALTAFGYSAKDASHFADVLAATATNANTNVAMMGDSFKYAAPVAGSLGYSVEDVALALGLMANNGIKADMAGTSLRNMFQRMAKPTKESAMAMDRLGLALYDDQGKMYSFREVMDQMRASMADINVSAEDYDKAIEALDKQLEDGTLTQKQYDKELEELNLQTFGAEGAEKARAAAMLGGARAMSGLLAISNASEDEYRQLADAIDNSSQSFAKLEDGSVVPLSEALASGKKVIEEYSGAAEAMAATMQDNLGGDLTKLKSELQEVAISFGKLLIPYLRELVGHVKEFVDKLNSLSDAEKMQIMKIAGLVAAIGPALIVIGSLTSAIGSIISVIGGAVKGFGTLITTVKGFLTVGSGLQGVFTALTGPVGIAVAAITALTAAFVYLYNTNENFKKTIDSIAATLQGQLTASLQSVIPALDQLRSSFEQIMTTCEPIFELIATSVAAMIANIIASIEPIVGIITAFMNTINASVQAGLALLQGDFSGCLTWILTYAQSWVELILNVFNLFVQRVVAVLKVFGIDLPPIFTQTFTSIHNTVSSILNTIKNTIQTVFNAVKNFFTVTLKNILNDFTKAFSNMLSVASSKITQVRDAIKKGLEDAADYIKSLPAKFLSWGKEMIQKLADGIKSKIGEVKSAAESVAKAISSYIHFSVPDVGPLHDIDTFMPDMINELVKGINNGIPRLESAMSGLSGSMASQLQPGTPAATGSTNNVNITVYGAQGQDVSELADIIEQKIADNTMRRGMAFG